MAKGKKFTISEGGNGFLAEFNGESRSFTSRTLAEAWGKVKKAPAFSNCSITLNPEERRPFIVSYVKVTPDGRKQRKRPKFPTIDAAVVHADEQNRKIENHGRRFAADLSEEEAAAISAWRKLELKRKSEGVVVESLSAYIRRGIEAMREAPDGRKIDAALVDKFIARKLSAGVGERQLSDYKSRLGRFLEVFEGRMAASLGVEEIEVWLDDLTVRNGGANRAPKETGKPVSAQARKNYRATLHAFFRWVHPERNPVSKIDPPKIAEPERLHYEPEEMRKLLQWILENKLGILPFVTLGAFCGLRSAEMERMDLSAIDLGEPDKEGEFILSAAKTKGKKMSRAVPLPVAAKAWLLAQSSRSGPVVKTSTRDLYHELELAHVGAGVKQIANGLRHSFATYRGAMIKDSGQLADEMGNSAAVVARHYRDAKLNADAETYFAIRPGQVSNLIDKHRVGV